MRHDPESARENRADDQVAGPPRGRREMLSTNLRTCRRRIDRTRRSTNTDRRRRAGHETPIATIADGPLRSWTTWDDQVPLLQRAFDELIVVLGRQELAAAPGASSKRRSRTSGRLLGPASPGSNFSGRPASMKVRWKRSTPEVARRQRPEFPDRCIHPARIALRLRRRWLVVDACAEPVHVGLPPPIDDAGAARPKSRLVLDPRAGQLEEGLE